MKQVEVCTDALVLIDGLRTSEEYELAKASIADSLSALANIISAGRDNDNVNMWTDDLLRVAYTIGQYNEMVNALYQTRDTQQGFYM